MDRTTISREDEEKLWTERFWQKQRATTPTSYVFLHVKDIWIKMV